MKKNYLAISELNEFLLTFIESQISKCFRILTIGVGPDVGIIALLVKKEIDDLIQHAQMLQCALQTNEIAPTLIVKTIAVIKFYLCEEALRGEAAFHMSDNPMHRDIKKRVQTQQESLNSISQSLSICYQSLASTDSLTKMQCQYRLTSLRVVWHHLDLITRRSADGLNEMATDIIRENSLPNGYYDQRHEEFTVFKAECEKEIVRLMCIPEMVFEPDILTLEQYHMDKARWIHALQRLRSHVEEPQQC